MTETLTITPRNTLRWVKNICVVTRRGNCENVDVAVGCYLIILALPRGVTQDADAPVRCQTETPMLHVEVARIVVARGVPSYNVVERNQIDVNCVAGSFA